MLLLNEVLWKLLIYLYNMFITLNILCMQKQVIIPDLNTWKAGHYKHYNWGLKLSLELITPLHHNPLRSCFVRVFGLTRLKLNSSAADWTSQVNEAKDRTTKTQDYSSFLLQERKSLIPFPTKGLWCCKRKIVLQLNTKLFCNVWVLYRIVSLHTVTYTICTGTDPMGAFDVDTP